MDNGRIMSSPAQVLGRKFHGAFQLYHMCLHASSPLHDQLEIFFSLYSWQELQGSFSVNFCILKKDKWLQPSLQKIKTKWQNTFLLCSLLEDTESGLPCNLISISTHRKSEQNQLNKSPTQRYTFWENYLPSCFPLLWCQSASSKRPAYSI